MTSWALIVIVAMGSYAMRYSLFGLVSAHPSSPRFDSAMVWVTPAVLGALLGPALVSTSGTGSPNVALSLALVVSLLVVAKTRNELHALAVGLPILWIANLLAELDVS